MTPLLPFLRRVTAVRA